MADRSMKAATSSTTSPTHLSSSSPSSSPTTNAEQQQVDSAILSTIDIADVARAFAVARDRSNHEIQQVLEALTNNWISTLDDWVALSASEQALVYHDKRQYDHLIQCSHDKTTDNAIDATGRIASRTRTRPQPICRNRSCQRKPTETQQHSTTKHNYYAINNKNYYYYDQSIAIVNN
jgi:hypothetical protein